MKTAIMNNQLIHLDKMDRTSYLKVYDEGKKGLLQCPVCSEKVNLFLGISLEPHFQHYFNKNATCSDPDSKMKLDLDKDDKLSKEITGFSLPQSRAITATANRVNHFKSPQAIKELPPFLLSEERKDPASSPYIQSLLESKVYLDANQVNAVTNNNGALLVLAGAGSGKTRVLTAKTAFLITEEHIKPNQIMLLTFTSKAANEMKNRLLRYPYISQAQIKSLVTGTFHSIFYRILAHHHPQKWNGTKLLSKEWMRGQIVKEAGRELHLDEKEFAFDAALQQIGYWKNSLIVPNRVKPMSDWEETAVKLYQLYEAKKVEKELFDFDDMLTGCIEFFQNQPKLLEIYQNRFHHFLIDEFQDVNKAQYELIKMLSSNTKNVCAVGDDDQSIYSFRGSNPQFLFDFENDFPNAEVIILNANYRSTHSIVATANKMIVQNKKRRPKKMIAQYTHEQNPYVFFPDNEEEEAIMIVTDISEKIASGAHPNDFAILFRTNNASRAIFERLTTSNLPFKIEQDIESFYERFIVKSMLSFLKLSLNEEDQAALSHILPVLFIKQNVIRDIKADSILKDLTLLECLSNLKTGYSFQEKKLKKMLLVIRSLSSISPLKAIEKIEEELGFQDFLKKRGNEGNRWEKGSDDLRDLKVAAKNFATIRDFLDHTDHMIAMNKEIKLQSKKREKAITLSTIHRAKGLEYNTVYIIGTVDGSIPHDYALESLRSGDSEPLEEERRLLYVAITRAKEELFLSVPKHWRGKKAKSSRLLSAIHH